VMGLTRPYLGMHYPSDVVVGAALGTALGKLVPRLDDHKTAP
jgi:membrane-associated phospholipid phosphatase